MLLQSFTQNVFSLRHRSFISINQQQYAINHGQYALYLAAKISMARGVKDVDFYAFMHNCSIFGKYGDTTLTLQSIGVHNAILYMFISTENTALLQHSINQSGLAMVNVGDNCYITNIISNHCYCSLLHEKQEKGCLSSASFTVLLNYYMLFRFLCQ